MSRRAFPYRRAASATVSTEVWTIATDDDHIELPDALADWDYRMNLALRRSLTVDLDLLRQSTGLPDRAEFAVAVIWTATGSGLKSAAHRVPLIGDGRRTVDLVADLHGTQLGGLLTIDTVLVLSEYCADASPTAPRRAGSVLWSDQHVVRLQGDAPQFPMAVIDFSKTAFPEDAGWYMQISGDLDSATMGALLLLINERKRGLVDALQNAGKPKPIHRTLLSAVYADVARTMVAHALREPEFSMEKRYHDESLGATLQGLVSTLFPERGIEDLRRRSDENPNLFSTELQHAVRIFEDVR